MIHYFFALLLLSARLSDALPRMSNNQLFIEESEPVSSFRGNYLLFMSLLTSTLFLHNSIDFTKFLSDPETLQNEFMQNGKGNVMSMLMGLLKDIQLQAEVNLPNLFTR